MLARLDNLIKYVKSNLYYRVAESTELIPDVFIGQHQSGETLTFDEVIENDCAMGTFRCTNKAMYYDGFGEESATRKCGSCKYLGDALTPFCGLKAAGVTLYRKSSKKKTLRMPPTHELPPTTDEEITVYGMIPIKTLLTLL